MWWIGQGVSDWLVAAFAIVLLPLVFRDAPSSSVAAARLDGMSGFGIAWHIVLPIARPALVSLVLLCLLATFLDFPWIARPHGYYGTIAALPPLKWEVINRDISAAVTVSLLSLLPLFAVFFIVRMLFARPKTASQS